MMFKLDKNSLAFVDGKSDMLSYQVGTILLGSPKKIQSVEIIYVSEITFTQHCMFTLGGAHYKNIELNGVQIEQNKVYQANKNDVIKLKNLLLGFRLYLQACPFDINCIGNRRGSYTDHFCATKNKIRVIKGPEFNYLDDPYILLNSPYFISPNSDLSGIRLIGDPIEASQYDIHSSVVDDGTIQLTESGMIVLLRARQVTGGYPRILSVIKADLDLLAQYKIAAPVRFELIELETAQQLLLQREKELNDFRELLS